MSVKTPRPKRRPLTPRPPGPVPLLSSEQHIAVDVLLGRSHSSSTSKLRQNSNGILHSRSLPIERPEKKDIDLSRLSQGRDESAASNRHPLYRSPITLAELKLEALCIARQSRLRDTPSPKAVKSPASSQRNRARKERDPPNDGQNIQSVSPLTFELRRGNTQHQSPRTNRSGAAQPLGPAILVRLASEVVRPNASREKLSKGNPLFGDLSIDATGQSFAPQLGINGFPLPDDRRRRTECRKSISKIGIGIETEFMLEGKNRPHVQSVYQFGEELAEHYNQQTPNHHPRMKNEMGFQEVYLYKNGELEFPNQESFAEWALTFESSIFTQEEPWGIEMKSPLFVAFPGSTWRDHLLVTWRYLSRFYKVAVDERCSTHIHVSIANGYNFAEIRRIAQCALYFETAFDALVPSHRATSCYARGSWLNQGQYRNALGKKSRTEAIESLNDVHDYHALMLLVNPQGRNFSWSFKSIIKFYTVEFRKPPGSSTAAEVLGWAELAMSFVQSSLLFGSLDVLFKIPPTLGGLQEFLAKSNTADMNEHHHYDPFFRGKHPNLFIEAVSPELIEDVGWKEMNVRREADRKRIQDLVRRARKPYL